jgi:hypothetical protein
LPFPNPDSIQEFNLQADNLSAQYGNAAGGIVNIATKSGTNDLHGAAWEFLRNDALNARNFFAPNVPTLRQNQFGGIRGFGRACRWYCARGQGIHDNPIYIAPRRQIGGRRHGRARAGEDDQRNAFR